MNLSLFDIPTSPVGNSTSPNGDWGSGGSGAKLGTRVVNTCGVFALLATLISLMAMSTHLKSYTKPTLQRFVIRIKWMIPVFALSSWISLVSLNLAFYVDAIRDVYEAFVIYCFFALMVNFMGGERGLMTKLYGRPPTKHMWPAYYFSTEMEVGDPYSFLFLKRGILQYVYIKPLIAIVTMFLKYNNSYDENDMSLRSGYFYITFVYNISVCISLYCLVFLFQTIKEDIKEYNPLAKFLCVKAIVFFTFWQGLAISALVSTGMIHLGADFTDEHTAVALQDSIICFELLFAAIAHWYAFTYKDYLPRTGSVVRLKLLYAFRDAIGIKDILLDSVETYSGSQYNYRTFEPAEVASVTEEGRRNRLRAGLRFSAGGQTKYWLDDSNRNNSSSRLLQDDASSYDTFSSDCSFEQIIHDSEAEELYHSSRNFTYGDYFIPTIEESPIFSPRPPSTPRRHSNSPLRHTTTSPTPPFSSNQEQSTSRSRVGSSLRSEVTVVPQDNTILRSEVSPEIQSSSPSRNPRPISPPVISRADSINVSPWGTSSLRANLNWEEELRRAANREFVQTAGQSDNIDPWGK